MINEEYFEIPTILRRKMNFSENNFTIQRKFTTTEKITEYLAFSNNLRMKAEASKNANSL